MTLSVGVFEVLSADHTSSVRGDADRIETTHKKEGWIKNVETQQVTQVKLEDSEVPLVAGTRIGLAFLYGKQVIAFKRSREIPVEIVGRDIRWSPIVLALGFSFPIIGYLAAMLAGLIALFMGMSPVGRRFNKIFASRLYGVVMIAYGALAFIQGQTMTQMINYHVTLAIVFAVLLMVIKFFVVRTENGFALEASKRLEQAWRRVA
ncbi:hypothetical protein [Pseudomonas sp. RIT-To-2]|uniref:hypothetical protein n=1 Tax=Pseudomonas sp. RIT-To-2 TaxID=3462541 RepID=UPI002413001E